MEEHKHLRQELENIPIQLSDEEDQEEEDQLFIQNQHVEANDFKTLSFSHYFLLIIGTIR